MGRDLRIKKTVDCPIQMGYVELSVCDKCPSKGARSKYLQTCNWDRFDWVKHKI